MALVALITHRELSRVILHILAHRLDIVISARAELPPIQEVPLELERLSRVDALLLVPVGQLLAKRLLVFHHVLVGIDEAIYRLLTTCLVLLFWHQRLHFEYVSEATAPETSNVKLDGIRVYLLDLRQGRQVKDTHRI